MLSCIIFQTRKYSKGEEWGTRQLFAFPWQLHSRPDRLSEGKERILPILGATKPAFFCLGGWVMERGSPEVRGQPYSKKLRSKCATRAEVAEEKLGYKPISILCMSLFSSRQKLFCCGLCCEKNPSIWKSWEYLCWGRISGRSVPSNHLPVQHGKNPSYLWQISKCLY